MQCRNFKRNLGCLVIRNNASDEHILIYCGRGAILYQSDHGFLLQPDSIGPAGHTLFWICS